MTGKNQPESELCRCIVAEDEALARERVRSFLAKETGVEIVAECPDGENTVIEVERLRPHLLFLDVQMPKLNGFQVLEALDREAMPEVIFTTAHDEYAIKAFEFSAVDYLLKPFSRKRFRQALTRARSRIRSASGQDGDRDLDILLRRIQSSMRSPRLLVRSSNAVLLLKAEEIDLVESAGNYVLLHSRGSRHIHRETMSAIEDRLSDAGFMRVSRSAIVNLNRVTQLRPLPSGQYAAVLADGQRVNVTCPLKELYRRLNGEPAPDP